MFLSDNLLWEKHSSQVRKESLFHSENTKVHYLVIKSLHGKRNLCLSRFTVFVLCQKQADTKYRLLAEFRQLLCNKFYPKWNVNISALLISSLNYLLCILWGYLSCFTRCNDFCQHNPDSLQPVSKTTSLSNSTSVHKCEWQDILVSILGVQV
jgi:hypothetical protein